MARIRSHRPRTIVRQGSTGETDLRDVLPKPRIPRVRGTRELTAMLPNGRVAWMSLDPAPTTAAELNRLRRAIERADVHHAAGLYANAAAVRHLSRRFTRDLGRLGRRRLARMRTLHERLIAGDQKNAQRFATELERLELEARDGVADERALVRRRRRRHLWDGILLASAPSLFAAYGQRGDPFAEHNLALTLSLAVWLLGDELSDLLSGPRRLRGAATVRDVDPWSYVAPLGNLLTAWWLFTDRQHERFVTGIADGFAEVAPSLQAGTDQPVEVLPMLPAECRHAYEARLDLAPVLASGHVDDFRTFDGVPAVATLISSEWDVALRERGARVLGVMAEVELGVLTLTVTIELPCEAPPLDDLPPPRVAWMVDTRDPTR